MNNIDANEIYTNLWIGSKPPEGRLLANAGFTHLFLCSDEYQPDKLKFENIEIIRCPFEDSDTFMSGNQLAFIAMAAKLGAKIHKNGGKILITCIAGKNRSALITALIARLLGKKPHVAVDTIKAKRNDKCLSNTCFLRIALGINKQIEFYL